ncbi:hypothetical protein OKW41_004783 [Paraburkholderia sp. UCT70]
MLSPFGKPNSHETSNQLYLYGAATDPFNLT